MMSEETEAQKAKEGYLHLNGIPCPGCGRRVDDRGLACPACGFKLDVEHPADITPTKNPPLQFPSESSRSLQPNAPQNTRKPT